MNKLYIRVGVYVGLVFSLGVLSFGGASAVGAYQVTDTPTSTITAQPGYIPSVMPTNSLDLNCGVGTPVSWGTVTPDSVWSVLCSHCMSTAIPSPTSLFTVTPSPTLGVGTPSVTPSPTTTPVNGGCLAVGVGVVVADVNRTGFVTCSVSPANVIECSGSVSWDFTGAGFANIDVPITFIGSPLIGYFEHDDFWEYGSGGSLSDITRPGIVYSFGTCEPVWNSGFNTSGSCNLSGAPMTGAFLRWVVYQDSEPDTDYTFSTKWSINGNCLAVTPVPTAVSPYCTVVNGGGGIPDDGFAFDGITFGSTACFDVGPIPTWDFGFLVVNVNIPWIAHLCLTNVDLGVIQAFGVSVSLLTLSYVWGVAWALRNLFTS